MVTAAVEAYVGTVVNTDSLNVRTGFGADYDKEVDEINKAYAEKIKNVIIMYPLNTLIITFLFC